MAVRPIVKYGHPGLHKPAGPVKEIDGTIHKLLDDMVETMYAAPGVGLAAPQIGVSQRVVIFGVDKNPRYPDAEEVPFTVLVNPTLTMLAREVESDWEGCLSVPGMRGVVPRYTKLRYTGTDEEGNPIDRTVEGFHARVVQHECDHLDGILYPQRMIDMRTFGFTKELFPDEEIADD